MRIFVKYFNENLPELKFIGGKEKSNWVDLYCGRRTTLSAGQYAAIPLGVGMILPEGYEAIVAPRSSTFKNYGILVVNSPGVIDGSYCGYHDQWHLLAYATRDTTIPEGDRICQFRIQKQQPDLDFVKVKELLPYDRGGIGSTGV